MERLVVTHHTGLVEWLVKHNYVQPDVKRVEFATTNDVRGKHVFGPTRPRRRDGGFLTFQKASLAARITEVELDIPRDMRGVVLTLEDVERFVLGVYCFVISRV